VNFEAFEEIRELALALHPPQFFARIDLWRKGDVTGTSYELRVSGTRSPKMLAFDSMDARLNEAEAEYREHLQGVSVAMSCDDEPEARRLLRKALKLQELWLKPIITPDKELAKELGRLASDAQSCNTCGDTKDAWVRRQKKSGVKTPLWRLRGGDCAACYQKKRRAKAAERPKELWEVA
jgi:hypothetical protein